MTINEGDKKLNISVIAQKAGVSRATVSRVLMNRGNVNQKTRQRVQEIMDSLNYVPNIMARGLAIGKLNIVGLVADLSNLFFSELIFTIGESLQKNGFLVTILSLEKNNELCSLKRILAVGYTGLIIVDLPNDEKIRNLIETANLPVVLLNRNAQYASGCDSIIVDNHMGGYLAARHLLELGHRRIAMLRGSIQSTASNDRYKGFVLALNEFGISEDQLITGIGEFNIESGERFTQQVFDQKSGVTAIFAGNDYMVIGVLDFCKRLGLRVPEDLSVFGISSTPLSGTTLLKLTCILQPYDKMGKMAVEKIKHRIEGDNSAFDCQVIRPKIIVGATTAPPAHSVFS